MLVRRAGFENILTVLQLSSNTQDFGISLSRMWRRWASSRSEAVRSMASSACLWLWVDGGIGTDGFVTERPGLWSDGAVESPCVGGESPVRLMR